MLDCRSPASKAYFALLLDRSRVKSGPEANAETERQALSVIEYRPDTQVVAEALAAAADHLVSFHRKHLVGNPRAEQLPFPVGTAGDFQWWYREQLAKG